MTEAQVPQNTEPRAAPSGGTRRVVARGAAIASILVGMLAMVDPAWAGPIMGC